MSISLDSSADLLQDEIDAAGTFLANQLAAATRRAYDSDYRIFETYCNVRKLQSLPAAIETVTAFLSAEAIGGAKAATIGRRVAAIAYAHRVAGLKPPTDEQKVKAVMSGIRRTIQSAKTAKAPATANCIDLMLKSCPNTIKGKRDRAILAFGFAGAFRRSELVALTTADLHEVAGGIRVTIRCSKTDQEALGHEIAVPTGGRLRPVEAMEAWLSAADIREGPIFRSITKAGRISRAPLSPESVSDIVKAYAQATGFDPAVFAAHSLRSGFLTSGAEAGANVFKLMEVSRHKSLESLRGYVRRADLFHDHAGERFL
jgi:site-specific recombinase XerD